jgi:ectoine hydroxylase-related dioxygenase (phytanoyl-CoA dioxygenase family)
MSDLQADVPGQALACGSAGSLLIFHGSTWHGHAANVSNTPRRSLQGAFIPRNGSSATNWGARMPLETRARLAPVASYVLDL